MELIGCVFEIERRVWVGGGGGGGGGGIEWLLPTGLFLIISRVNTRHAVIRVAPCVDHKIWSLFNLLGVMLAIGVYQRSRIEHHNE